MREFYSKILLFGEYSVLRGSKALTIPYRYFSANLHFTELREYNAGYKASNDILRTLAEFLESNSGVRNAGFDLDRFRREVKEGLCLRSSIPEKYGLGSSGALVAALFDRYMHDPERFSLSELKDLMAEAESFFHGSSSGIDPISCYVSQPLIFEEGGLHAIDQGSIRSFLERCFLYDCGKPAATGKFINTFLESLNDPYFVSLYKKYITAVDLAIDRFTGDDSGRIGSFFRIISEFQMSHFIPMIPGEIIKIWKKGLDTNRFYFKLCGSGGGGYMLIFSALNEEELKSELGPDLLAVSL